MAVAGAAAETLASCSSSPDCISLGYKYTLSDCPNGGVKCPFDTSKYFCFSPESACTYTKTTATCAAECKNVGSQSCTRSGVTYYNACGSSKCSSGQSCNNGTCVSSCTYMTTKATCNAQCKKVGTTSCQKDGVTYYESCGSSKCANGQTCKNGSCISVPTEGYCCGDGFCGYSGTTHYNDKDCQNAYGMSCYDKCMQVYGGDL